MIIILERENSIYPQYVNKSVAFDDIDAHKLQGVM